MTTATVRQAAARDDINHREPEYLALIRETKTRLLSVYPQLRAEGWVPYIIGGSGTAAVEAMITSTVRRGPVLVIESGYYSARIRQILEIHRIPTVVHSVAWDSAINLDLVAEALAKEPFEALVMTHDETTLGRLNDIHSIGQLCEERGVKCLVDAMSSFGADTIDFSHLSAVAASANKCLHGLPGVSFVLVRPELAADMREYPRRSYYMHLPLYEGDVPGITPPVSTLSAFCEALRENPGAEARGEHYLRQATLLRSELRARGFETALPDEQSSRTLTTVNIPHGWTYDDWFEANLKNGYVIYACKGEFREKFFQLSTMGEVTDEHIKSWLVSVDLLLAEPA